ncbi:hypothetical protein [Pseudobacteriovorax antillogorgiicola]|uniref:Uncharacterized protein n=2 Tax=Pseudobacteriovorax antillogorgiicola TaxID=1513793 RepID=A0A1Y6CXV8_9BACT|nr:hypothetical protein [Pseudobacteriovorax antillogorgiicola]TCS42745.1 hypothetical protein EDD56_14013 [Pseudobacteriovorax antillogorgiicola]SMF82224.1 hypothetical protein SAMN06296036_14013 [Pseudobacteriovorax antillogorgiicola]
MLIDDVIRKLQSYFDSGRNRNMATLVRKTPGVSYSTIRRLMQREVTDPSIENTVVPLLSNFMTPSEIVALIAPYKPEWSASYNATIESDRVVAPTNPEFDHVDFFIMGLGSHENGTTRETIARRYGEVLGLGRLEYLLEEGFLMERGGRIFSRDRRTTGASPREAIKRIEASAKWFDATNIGKGAAFFNQLEYQSQDEYDKTHKALSRLVKELKVIRENSVGPKDRLANISILLNYDDRKED